MCVVTDRCVCTDVLSKACRLYNVSPLWRFSSAQRDLRTYSQQLTGLLAALPQTQGGKKVGPYVGVVSSVTNPDTDDNFITIRVTPRRRTSTAGTEVNLFYSA